MYLSFYGLKIKPFQNSTNPEFFWLGEKQKETLAIFKYGLSKLPGILLLTGDAGTGKTTLINVFLNSLGDQIIVIKIPDPDLEDIDFRNYIADALDFKTTIPDQGSFFANFSYFLNTTATLGKKVILIIDECQRLSSKLLEEIIKLANIQNEETKLLKILLIGQNEFDDFLKKNTSRVLHQLIAINCAIAPFDLHETGEFIRHRLKIAGANRDIFSPEAITKIYEISAGIPCKINIICDIALLYGFGQKSKTVNGELIWECTENLRPQNYVNTRGNNPWQFGAGGDAKKIPKRSPEPALTDAKPWRRKTLGISILLMLPVFLMTYFTDLRTFFKNPHRVETQIRPPTSDSTIHKVPAGTADTEKITPISTTPVTKEEAKNDDRPSRTGDLPTSAPLNTVHVPENASTTQILTPVSADRQKIAQDPAITRDSTPTNTAAILQSASKVSQEENPQIEKDLKLEKEITVVPEPADIPVIKKNKTENTVLVDKKIGANGKVTIGQKTKKETQDALPDNARQSSATGGTEQETKEPPENIDPGAIIDWVIKNRPK